jgi:hypothetical protein
LVFSNIGVVVLAEGDTHTCTCWGGCSSSHSCARSDFCLAASQNRPYVPHLHGEAMWGACRRLACGRAWLDSHDDTMNHTWLLYMFSFAFGRRLVRAYWSPHAPSCGCVPQRVMQGHDVSFQAAVPPSLMLVAPGLLCEQVHFAGPQALRADGLDGSLTPGVKRARGTECMEGALRADASRSAADVDMQAHSESDSACRLPHHGHCSNCMLFEEKLVQASAHWAHCYRPPWLPSRPVTCPALT